MKRNDEKWCVRSHNNSCDNYSARFSW